MGNIDPNMTGTPDPKDTGDAVVPETTGADETTVFNPVGLVEDAENTDEVGEMDSAKPRPKWLVPAIAAGVAVVVLGAGIGGYAYALNNVNAGVQAASSWNKASVKTLKKTVEDAQAILDKTGEDQVADPQVLEALSSAIDKAKAKAAKGVKLSPNGMLVWELLDAENAYDESTENILDLDTNLGKAVRAVEKSVADKTLKDAKDSLSKAIDSAQSTLDGSDGKVQDNATRDALSKAIDTARKALDGSNVDAMNTAKGDLDAKTKAVNDSVKAKEQADADAQAQTEAEASANANNSYAGGGYSNGYNGGYTGGYSGNAGNGYNNSGNGTNNTWTGNNPVAPWLGQDSMGNDAHYSNSNCTIYNSDGTITDVPCS